MYTYLRMKKDVRGLSEEIASTCALLNLRKAARATAQIYERIMSRCGLTGPQFGALVAMSLKREWTLTPLAEALTIDRTTLTRNLALMEKQGLIQIGVGADRRERVITLTEQGQTILSRAIPLWRSAQDQVAAILGKERLGKLVEELKQVSSALSKA
jgi:DNA-binding MarR family transcriptional regulator